MYDVIMHADDIIRHLVQSTPPPPSSFNQSATEPSSSTSSSPSLPPFGPSPNDLVGELVAIVAFLSALSLVGTVGNAIVLWVFWARRDRAVATLFIVVLALLDLTTCLVVVPFTVYMESVHFLIELDALCKLFQVSVISTICL